jgi:hypothetical protein
MGELRECAICGAAYSNAAKHQRFHDEVDELLDRYQAEQGRSVGRRRRDPQEVRTGGRRAPR